MSIDSKPTCPIISRFAEDLKLNAKSPRTVQSYCRALRKFTEYLRHTPDQATEDQLRKYLLYVVDKKSWAGARSTSRYRPSRSSIALLVRAIGTHSSWPASGRAEFAGGSLDR